MVHHELFNFVFSSGSLAELLRAQAGSNQWINKMDSVLQGTKYTKGQLLLSMGHIPEAIYFLQSGAVRAYYYDEKGKQCTLYLWDRYSIVTDIVHYIEKEPSDLFIEVCEDANFLFLARPSLDKIIHEFPESVLFLNGILLHFTQHHRQRDKDFQTLTAKQRFNKLKQLKNKIELLFSREYIASYLGISRGWFYDVNSRKKK